MIHIYNCFCRESKQNPIHIICSISDKNNLQKKRFYIGFGLDVQGTTGNSLVSEQVIVMVV